MHGFGRKTISHARKIGKLRSAELGNDGNIWVNKAANSTAVSLKSMLEVR